VEQVNLTASSSAPELRRRLDQLSPEEKVRIEERLAVRSRSLKDKLYLATEILGYDFVADVHEELFGLFIPYDPSKPWAMQSDIVKRMILWPRGHFKTTAIVVEIIQIILNFPDIRILIMQGSVGVTQTLLKTIKAHFTGENPNSRLREFFPEFCADRLGNADQFTVPARKNKGLAQATVTVASPRKVKTGQHYDIGFFDDLVNDQNYRSKTLLKKVEEDFGMCLPLLDMPFFAYVTGTRYAFGDLYENIIRYNTKKEWTVSVKTCWRKRNVPLFPQQLSRDSSKYVGFTRDGLLLLQARDPEMFASQYLNQPIQRGGQRFTKELMESLLILPKDVPPLSPAVFFIDLAATDSVESDDSVIIVGKTDMLQNQYVVDCRGDRWLPPILAQNIIEMALIHRPIKIFFEKTASCMYFVEALRLIARQHNIFLPIEFIKIDNREDAKHIRIAMLESYFRGKKIRFFAGLNRWDRIVEQFGRFPGGRGKHDDYPDTIAYMAQTFGGEALARPVQTAINPILAMVQQIDRERSMLVPPEPDDGSDGFFAF
jgi:predicted phage terminase large subunit-like protein